MTTTSTLAVPHRACSVPRHWVLNALTIDVEDYYHVSAFEDFVSRREWGEFESRVVASTRKILDILNKADVRATFFVLGWVAKRHPDLVRAIHEAGHEIGCHSYWHRLVYRLSPEEFRDDVRQGRDVLQNITNGPVTMYRAPSFSITRRCLWALDILIEEGFTHDSSVYPVLHDRYGIPGAPAEPHRIRRPAGEIVESPPPVCRLLGMKFPVAGGGYFRLYPYGLTWHGVRAIHAEARPAVVYLHPWEVDPEQPRLPCGRATAFRHYVNLAGTEGRLRRLVRDFSFGTLSDAVAAFTAQRDLAEWAPES